MPSQVSDTVHSTSYTGLQCSDNKKQLCNCGSWLSWWESGSLTTTCLDMCVHLLFIKVVQALQGEKQTHTFVVWCIINPVYIYIYIYMCMKEIQDEVQSQDLRSVLCYVDVFMWPHALLFQCACILMFFVGHKSELFTCGCISCTRVRGSSAQCSACTLDWGRKVKLCYSSQLQVIRAAAISTLPARQKERQH